jgi:hypothetical protein
MTGPDWQPCAAWLTREDVSQGGLTQVYATNVTGNNARQQGGGIAFVNICGSSSSCALELLNGTTVEGNSAQSGGGVFVAVPGNTGVNLTQISSRSALG